MAVAGTEEAAELQVLLVEFRVEPVGQEYVAVAGAVVTEDADVMEQELPERV